jgi:hypothetical protein
MEIQNHVEPLPPDPANQRRYLPNCAPRGPVSHGHSVHGNNVVDCGTQFGDWRAPMTGQEGQLRIGKSIFQGRQRRKQQDHIAEPSEPDCQDFHVD